MQLYVLVTSHMAGCLDEILLVEDLGPWGEAQTSMVEPTEVALA